MKLQRSAKHIYIDEGVFDHISIYYACTYMYYICSYISTLGAESINLFIVLKGILTQMIMFYFNVVFIYIQI